MRIRLLAVLLLFFGLATAAGALPHYGQGLGYGTGPSTGHQAMPGELTPPASEAIEESPGAQLRDGMNKLLGFLKRDERPAIDEVVSFLNSEIAVFFDFAYMAQVAAGPMYRVMSEDQRERMAAQIQQQFLTTLGQRLGSYQNQEVHFLASRIAGDGRTGSASAAILSPDGYPSRIDFRFYNSGDGWKVYDVLANGQSAVAHYRREFRSLMRGYRPNRHGYHGGRGM